ncbi:ABC transporter substrate-binding protein [Pseudonocardia sp. KRD-182]|uniref:ABC transporter substrate-binding protein n=1 Tax=Pseudonocardia oceani TaxID=2792013 RepID=UPI001C49E29D|nr:ABC transporter substrate-binding protein [Pseudonocardia oceani]MBW0109755.1 ABC transporter substrate-binding protein [Pseudonocardia oceani]
MPARFSSGDGDWVGVAARSTVLVYNSSLIAAEQLPGSIVELSEPQWKDRIAVAAGGADFQAIASAVFASTGRCGGGVAGRAPVEGEDLPEQRGDPRGRQRR